MSSGYKFRFVALLLFVNLTETCSIYEILILNLELFCCGFWPRARACMLGTPVLLGSLIHKTGRCADITYMSGIPENAMYSTTGPPKSLQI